MFAVRGIQCQDFELQILDHCIFTSGIQRSFVKPQLADPRGDLWQLLEYLEIFIFQVILFISKLFNLMDQYIYIWCMIVCLDVHRSNGQLEPTWQLNQVLLSGIFGELIFLQNIKYIWVVQLDNMWHATLDQGFSNLVANDCPHLYYYQ